MNRWWMLVRGVARYSFGITFKERAKGGRAKNANVTRRPLAPNKVGRSFMAGQH